MFWNEHDLSNHIIQLATTFHFLLALSCFSRPVLMRALLSPFLVSTIHEWVRLFSAVPLNLCSGVGGVGGSHTHSTSYTGFMISS